MWLHTINPSVKMITTLLLIIVLALSMNPWLYIFFWAGLLLLTFTASRISWKLWALLTAPFVVMAAGYVWTAMLFPNPELLAQETMLWEWGWIRLTEESLARSVALGMRVITFSALSLLFVLTTKPTDLMLSLMQQLKMPTRLVYGVLAGYQFLPLIRSEYRVMRQAQAIRGVGQPKNFRERLLQWRSFIIPLLASAIRKAERTAVAMESKGFSGEPRTQWFRRLHISSRDYTFVALLSGLFLFSLAIAEWLL